jgi:hypothetical protein
LEVPASSTTQVARLSRDPLNTTVTFAYHSVLGRSQQLLRVGDYSATWIIDLHGTWASSLPKLCVAVAQLLLTSSPAFPRPHRHRNVAEAGDEDDGQIEVGLLEFLLKIQPTQVRQAHIERDAARAAVDVLGVEKVVGGTEQISRRNAKQTARSSFTL